MTPTDPADSAQFDRQLRIDDDGPPYPPVDDQKAVLASYFEGTGRVVVDASAGTGKTSTLVTTLAETIVRTATDSHNPLSEMLVTTFGREATAELKSRLKTVLRHHQALGGDLPQAVFRWIETESHIQTLDSFFADLLGEIAIEVGVPPDFEVDNRLEGQRIRQDVFEELRAAYHAVFRDLEAAYPAADHREYPPQSVESLLFEAHQRCREFGISPADAVDSLRESLLVSHGGHSDGWDTPPTDGPESVPPETIDDVEAILKAVVDADATLEYDEDDDAEQLLAHVRSTYFATEDAIDAFGTLLVAFDQRYDRQTRRAGQFTFTDVAHLLYSHIEALDAENPFSRTLGERFDHVFVDEFQDTSAVQCAVLRRLVDADQPADDSREPAQADAQATRSNLFVIGDSKQAIYEWRSADPALFADIIETASSAAPEPAAVVPHLWVRDVQYHALSTVFRHHPAIAAAANHCFQRLLGDEGRGAIGEHTPSYIPVEPHDSPWEALDESQASSDGERSHVHVLNVGATDEGLDSFIAADEWATAEAHRIGETIGTMLESDGEPVTIQTDDGPRAPTAGDITLLFRSRRQMQQYASVLRETYELPVVADASGDLFEQPEIELLVDILLWIATPYSDRDLRRLLRSPLVALSDATIRAAVSGDLETLCESWPERLPDDDRQRLAGLVSLRADLSHHRETAKTALIYRLIDHAGFEAILLGEPEPLRRYGSIWLLTELVDEWELDELLSYREFCRRLRGLRATTDSNDPQYAVAETTDPVDSRAVILKTVHQAKGQEYPIVFLCDLPKPSNYPRLQHRRLLMSRQYGFALRPRSGEPPTPAGVSFPTPDSTVSEPVWFNNDFREDYPDATGPIWLSDARTDSGSFRYSNPLNVHLAAQQAEFWRLAYVAFTRAEDHVFLGLGELDETESEYYDSARWSTWLAGFNGLLQPEVGWNATSSRHRDQRTITHRMSWSTPSGEQTHEIPIGVDEIEPYEPPPADPLDVSDELPLLDDPPATSGHPPFRPQSLTASSLGDLADCPRAFQYRQLHGIESTESSRHRPSSQHTTTPPVELAAQRWGEVVHRLIELRLESDTRADTHLAQQSDGVRAALRSVLSAVESTPILENCQSPSAEACAEYELSALVSTPGTDLRVTGIVDLLYQLDGEWHIVDWKTGARPAAGAATAHRRQLAVYAWLLAEQFDITVETATVAYIDPDGSPVVLPVELDDLDTAWVERTVQSASEGLEFDADGLEARPAPDICGSCPYAATNGGPCVDDYYTE